jgi:hypothetical protein
MFQVKELLYHIVQAWSRKFSESAIKHPQKMSIKSPQDVRVRVPTYSDASSECQL